MTPNNQRIALAKLCGWTFVEMVRLYGEDVYLGRDPHGEFAHQLPDYLNDLNVMHETEKLFLHFVEQMNTYSEFLRMIVEEETTLNTLDHPSFILLHATAAQRAKAFLQTFDQWRDAQ
jgi:hypothetical protein